MSPFLFDADHLALDFLNTNRGPDAVPVERLDTPEAVLAWLRAAGLAGASGPGAAGSSPPELRILLTEAHRLRDAVSDAVGAWTGGTLVPDAAIHVLNRALEARFVTERVDPSGASVRLEESAVLRDVRGLLAPVARGAAQLLAEGDPGRVRRCHGPTCSLWFLDTSRNGRRRWCSMARCGNRAKVAAHYRRSRERDR